ncbi:MAG TPA: polysaccharide biosynthesis tyrosine autokinase [Chitinispirillaceae bacterium]|nr:polysaccharide biosynthesis tyrosine autokinase [Chitinispirillaceae bacterium]
MQQPAQKSLRELDLGYYIQKYIALFWRWRWYMVISGPLVAICFLIYMFKFGTLKPELQSVATIVLDNTPDMSGRYSSEADPGGLEFIRTRNFLTTIVNTLSLRLSIADYQRNEIFDSVFVDSIAPSGLYVFEVDKENRNFQLYLTSRQLRVEKKIIESGELYKLDKFTHNGLSLKFSKQFLKEPFTFKYNVVHIRSAVDRLLRTVTTQYRTLVRGGPIYVSVTCNGRDYPLITKTTNLIVKNFIDLSQGSKKQKAIESVANLEKQLQTASEQLEIAQDSVENFRRRYPNVGLGTELMGNVNSIASLESGSMAANAWAEEAQKIRSRLAMSNENDLSFYVKEALIFLAGRGVAGGAVLQQEFLQLQSRQMELSTGYDKSHPYVIEVKNKIAEIRTKADALLSEYAVSAASESQRQSNMIQSMTSQLRGLPLLQARLAELERQSQVTSKIHSALLERYQQAQISITTEVEGVRVMDYAIEPVPPSEMASMMQNFLIAIAIMLGVSIGLPILADLLDKTVRNEIELKKLMDFTILESIPEIIRKDAVKNKKIKKKKQKNSTAAPKVRKIEDKLITADYTPELTNELFRSLRAKIMLHMHDITQKTIIISSYGMNEGKSLIGSNLAITMAQQQLKTLIIDGDIRRGVIHNSFVLNKKPGLSNFLFSESPVTEDAARELIQSTHVPNLSIISSGANVPNPSELLSLTRFKDLMECLKNMSDVIILDTPPLCVAADAAIAGVLFSACVLVVRAGKTNVIDFRKKLTEFPNLRKKVIGLVLNEAMIDRKMKEYQYSMYHY